MVAALPIERVDTITADAVERLNAARARESRETYRANAAALRAKLREQARRAG